MALQVQEKPVATNTASGVWRDRSPLVLQSCQQTSRAHAPQTRRADWRAPPARRVDPARVAWGEVGFGGVTTACDFDGMALNKFSQVAAFATTATEFAAATRKTVDFVARAMEGRQLRVA